MICQQTARACLKDIANPTNLPQTAEYLSRSHSSAAYISSHEERKDSNLQLRILEARARQAVVRLGKLVRQGTPWKDLNVDCVSVSRGHIEVFILRTFIDIISANTDSTLDTPLTKLQNLVSHCSI